MRPTRTAGRLVAVLCSSVALVVGGSCVTYAGFTSTKTQTGWKATTDSLNTPNASVPATNVSCVSPSGSTIKVTWSTTSDAYYTGYNLYWSENNVAQPTPIAIAGRSTTSYTFPVTNGVTYRFQVSTTYLNWESGLSGRTTARSC
ncbi:MAG: fibronectin type III domain-containing protein [Oryzihumus sp.]